MNNITNEENDLEVLLDNYISGHNHLIKYKKLNFPSESIVKINCYKYKGLGIVRSNEEKPHKLAVELENGNVWDYDILNCKAMVNRQLYPKWIKNRLKNVKRIYTESYLGDNNGY